MNQMNVEAELLDWRQKSLKAIIDCTNNSEDLHQLIMWSKYSQIPLCNL